MQSTLGKKGPGQSLFRSALGSVESKRKLVDVSSPVIAGRAVAAKKKKAPRVSFLDQFQTQREADTPDAAGGEEPLMGQTWGREKSTEYPKNEQAMFDDMIALSRVRLDLSLQILTSGKRGAPRVSRRSS